APRVADQYRGPGIRLAARTDPRDAVTKSHDLAERDARLPVEQRDLSSRPGRRRLDRRRRADHRQRGEIELLLARASHQVRVPQRRAIARTRALARWAGFGRRGHRHDAAPEPAKLASKVRIAARALDQHD